MNLGGIRFEIRFLGKSSLQSENNNISNINNNNNKH